LLSQTTNVLVGDVKGNIGSEPLKCHYFSPLSSLVLVLVFEIVEESNEFIEPTWGELIEGLINLPFDCYRLIGTHCHFSCSDWFMCT